MSKTHGHTVGSTIGGKRSPTYNSWMAMIGRCYRKSTQYYDRYGGRGIAVCDRWRLFDNFLADMGDRPHGTTLDRINNDGNYEPGNCKWSTAAEQARNMSHVKLTVADVHAIRARVANGESRGSVARSLGMQQSMISMIVSRRRWGSV